MQCKGKDIEIPVLLADAVYSPASYPDGDQKVVEYSIGSQQANLKVILPADLAHDRVLLDKVFQIMGEEIENDTEFPPVSKALVKAKILSKTQANAWNDHLKTTYDQSARTTSAELERYLVQDRAQLLLVSYCRAV